MQAELTLKTYNCYTMKEKASPCRVLLIVSLKTVSSRRKKKDIITGSYAPVL